MPKIGFLYQRLDLVNEFLVQCVTVHLFPLSDTLNTSPFNAEVLQYNVGYSMSSFLTILELVNVLVVIWFILRQIYLISLKYYRRFNRVEWVGCI